MPEHIFFIINKLAGRDFQSSSVRISNRLALSSALRLIAVLFLFFFTSVNLLLSQSVGDYRTNGNVQFNTAANWQVYNGTSWIAALTDPGSASGLITVRSGHTATLTISETLDQLIVEAGGTLRINSSRTLYIGNGSEPFDLDVYGTVNNYGSINTTSNPGSAIRFNNDSFYNHRLNGGTIPEASWLVNSTCSIVAVTSTLPSGLNQVFGNLTWNSPGQTADVI